MPVSQVATTALLLRAAAHSLRVVCDGDAGEGLSSSLRQARDALVCTNAVFCAVDDSGRLAVRAAADPEGMQRGDLSDVVTTLSARVLTSGEAARVTAGDLLGPGATAGSGQAPAMAVPIPSYGRVVGVLSVSRVPGAPDYTDDELTALLELGAVMGAAAEVERHLAEREAAAAAAVREQMGQALFDSVVSHLLQATTGLSGVIASVDDRQRGEVTRSVLAVDRAIVELRGILAGRLAAPSPAVDNGSPAIHDQAWIESTVGFSGLLAAHATSGSQDVRPLIEVDDYVVTILNDLFGVTVRLALIAPTVNPRQGRVLAESIRQLDALTVRVRAAAKGIEVGHVR